TQKNKKIRGKQFLKTNCIFFIFTALSIDLFMTQANPAHFIPYIILALALQLIYSCINDNAKFIAGTNSVVNHIENDSNYTLFLQAIEGAGLRGEWDA